LGQALDHRHAKSQRFAGAGLRNAHYILAQQGVGDGLVLDWGGDLKMVTVQNFQELGDNPQSVKSCCLWCHGIKIPAYICGRVKNCQKI
jgi:hypothetical protein